MIDINSWTGEYIKAVNGCFGSRVALIGLQGSYARNEATDHSDIDMVLILDRVDAEDLRAYRNAVARLPHRELLCGFVSGRQELRSWSEPDVFQLAFDTIPLQGSLQGIIPQLTAETARQAAWLGACNLYHGCVHNYLHRQKAETLRTLFKTAFFTMQADYYFKTGKYLRSRADMAGAVRGLQHEVLQVILNTSVIDVATFDRYSELLLQWASEMIRSNCEGSYTGP